MRKVGGLYYKLRHGMELDFAIIHLPHGELVEARTKPAAISTFPSRKKNACLS